MNKVLAEIIAGVIPYKMARNRWRGLLLPIDPSIKRTTTFNAVNIGYIANFVFPRIGEFVRCGVITGNSAQDSDGKKLASYDKVLGTVVLERSWDMVTMMIFMVCLLVFRWDKFGRYVYRHDFVRGIIIGFSVAILYTVSNALFSGLWHVKYGSIISWAIAIALPTVMNVWMKKHLSEKNPEE